jgi:hypothetical protein
MVFGIGPPRKMNLPQFCHTHSPLALFPGRMQQGEKNRYQQRNDGYDH